MLLSLFLSEQEGIWLSEEIGLKVSIPVGAVEINMSFSFVLLNILPVPKERIELQGNVALSQSMKRDFVIGIRAFQSRSLNAIEIRRPLFDQCNGMDACAYVRAN